MTRKPAISTPPSWKRVPGIRTVTPPSSLDENTDYALAKLGEGTDWAVRQLVVDAADRYHTGVSADEAATESFRYVLSASLRDRLSDDTSDEIVQAVAEALQETISTNSR